MKVAFFLWFYSDYYIFELDEHYQYVVVGSSSDKYLWILSRDKSLPEAVMEDLRPDALKIGMVSEPALVKIIAGCLLKYPHCPIVYDPVMVSTSGRKLMAKDAIQLIKEELFPLTSLITPNLDETEVLTGKKITTAEEMKEAARQLSEEYHT